jgi:hypothetical protein
VVSSTRDLANYSHEAAAVVADPAVIIGFMARRIANFYEDTIRPYFSRHLAGLDPLPPGMPGPGPGAAIANALIFNMVIGIVALMTGKTGEIITIACFGALALYIISMVSFFFLRKNEPDMERPFRVPFYPLFPALALSIATFSIFAMTWYNLGIAAVFFGIMGLSYLGFVLFIRGK